MRPEPSGPVQATDGKLPTCARCGGRRVRRSSAHGSWEHFLRRLTPVRFHVCGDCGARGWHWGVRTQRHASQLNTHESHHNKPHRRYRHLVRSLILAAALGAGAALYLHQCSGREAPTPGTIVGS